MMKLIKYFSKQQIAIALKRPAIIQEALDEVVSEILTKVSKEGDKALLEYNRIFDKATIDNLQVSPLELRASVNKISPSLKAAIDTAYKNIFAFHEMQKEEIKPIETSIGVTCWRKSVPIEKVGLYIPGGTAPLFSTVLMLGIPSQIAGCKEVVLCTPASSEGDVNPAILYAALSCGITKVFKVGGAQAIAAMAFGTETIPAVYKIFGPGNQYVTCAKQLVAKQTVAIDMPAGPSELMIYADETCVPAFVAADLLSQAEHGTDSQVVLVSKSEEVIIKVKRELSKQVEQLPRAEIAKKSLNNSVAVIVQKDVEALEVINEYAPEHLIIACENFNTIAAGVINAGSVFLGNYSCESAGDYASGTNHTLPTNGFSKAYSGVSLDSFVRKITFQKIDEEGLKNLGPCIETMAEAEGLVAHKNAVSIRLKQIV